MKYTSGLEDTGIDIKSAQIAPFIWYPIEKYHEKMDCGNFLLLLTKYWNPSDGEFHFSVKQALHMPRNFVIDETRVLGFMIISKDGAMARLGIAK